MTGRAAALWLALSIGLASAGAAQPLPAAAASETAEAVPQLPTAANVLTNWIIATHDNGKLPFIVIDKVGARLTIFDADGQPRGEAPVLVGAAKGDDSAPGVGDRELSHIPLSQRTTPAG